MPMVPMDIDSSTVAATSAVTAAITFFFSTVVLKLESAPALVIAVTVGIVLYAIGVVPIGFLIVVGISMIVAIYKSMTSGHRMSASDTEKARRRALGYDE